jgi:DNA recombination protein RmuC
MEFLIIGAGIGLVFGVVITRLFFPKKYYETKEIYDEELVNNFNSLKTDYEVLKKELEMNIARKNEMLDFKNDMLREVKSTVKETTQEGQAPYIKKLITDSENVKSQLVDLENKKKDLERDKQLAERKNDEALLKGKYSINVRGVNSEDVMQQVILNSGFIEGKNVWFRKKQAGINGIPDATLTYPKGRKVICDSKAPLDKFDEIIEAGQIGDRDKITKLNAEFGKNVIKHVDDLSSKNYQKAVNSMDFVIMFLPSENHVRIARDCVQLHQKNLDDYAFERNILVVGPSSFYPYVSKINELWKHHENIATQDNTLKVIKFAFKAIRILSELVDKTRKKIDEAARAAEDLDKSYNSTFTRAAEKVKDAGFSDDEIDKITNKNAEIIDLNDKKK